MGIGRMAAAGAIVVAGLGVFGACGWDITKEKYGDEAEITDRFSSVRFANESGNITIRAGDRPSVARDIFFEDDKPGGTHRVEDGVLILESCQENGCWIDYEVVVPEGTRIDGEVDSGNVEVEGTGPANLKAGSGNVTVRDAGGPVNVELSSGNADLVDLHDSAQVRAASGNVTISLDDPGDVRARVSSGNVEVTVPSGAYRVDISSDSGEATSEVTDDERGDHQLELSSHSGSVSVRQA